MKNSMRCRVFVVVLSLVTVSCSRPPVFPPRLGIINNGAYAIEDLVVVFPGSRIEFEEIPAGASSEYVEVPLGVYRYATFLFSARGRQHRDPAVDFVGEAPMVSGNIAYVVEYVPMELLGELRLTEVRRNAEVVFQLPDFSAPP